MAFQAVPDTVEIDVIYTLNAVTVQNTFYASLVGGYVLTDLQALADEIDLRVSGEWKSEQPVECVYVRSEVRGLAVENDLVATANAAAGPGTHIGNSLPNQVTFAIKKTSGLTGRSARGRTYWIGIPDNELEPGDENLLLAPYAALLVANVASIRNGIAFVGLWQPVLVSRFSGGLPRAVGVTFPWIGEINVDLRIDTQRGRLPTM